MKAVQVLAPGARGGGGRNSPGGRSSPGGGGGRSPPAGGRHSPVGGAAGAVPAFRDVSELLDSAVRDWGARVLVSSLIGGILNCT